MRLRTRRACDRAAGVVGALLALVAVTACSDRPQTAADPPRAASCAIGSAVHEHRLADEPELRASIHGTVLGRLETAAGRAHVKDSGSPGIDAIAYRIEEPTTLRLTVGPGTVARARLLDGSGTELAAVRAGEAARLRVAPGEHTLVLESDGRREGHFVVHADACLGANARDTRAGRVAASDDEEDDEAYENRKAPGVYVQELSSAPSSVVQASTTIAAFVGYVGSGPLDRAVLVESSADLATQFLLDDETDDGPDETRVLDAVTQFFAGGGSAAYVVGTPSGSVASLLGDPANDTGIHALPDFAWSMLVLPDVIDLEPDDATTVLQAAVPLAASALAFTVIEPPLALGLSDAAAVAAWVGGTLVPALPEAALPFAATYYPQSFLPSSDSAAIASGAVGAIAGAFAANDDAAGVWVAPSGAPRGLLPAALGVPLALDDAGVATLAAARVNAILLDTWQGAEVPALTGSSTLAAPGTQGSDVALSRTDLMIRASLAEALAWVVFEPSDETLWDGVTALVAAFLQQLWLQGVLVGDSPAQAFEVTCGPASSDDAVVVNVRLRLVGAPATTTYVLTMPTET